MAGPKKERQTYFNHSIIWFLGHQTLVMNLMVQAASPISQLFNTQWAIFFSSFWTTFLIFFANLAVCKSIFNPENWKKDEILRPQSHIWHLRIWHMIAFQAPSTKQIILLLAMPDWNRVQYLKKNDKQHVVRIMFWDGSLMSQRDT